MLAAAPARSSEPQARVQRYERHRRGQTLLYRIVEQHYLAFVEHMAGQGIGWPDARPLWGIGAREAGSAR